MKRIDGDFDVAVRLRAAADLIRDVLKALSGGPGPDDHADRCILATAHAVRAQMVLNGALSDLEQVTGVPWVALGIDPMFGKQLDEPPIQHHPDCSAYDNPGGPCGCGAARLRP